MNPLAAHYRRFRVAERLLLTGHSHQAWPDVGFEAQQRAWLDAAALVDDKWDAAAEQAARVREGYARLLGDAPANLALGHNTHELVTRWLSALPLRTRPRIVTTDGEFHSIRRQVDRLAEEGLFEIVKIEAHPVDALAGRLARAVDDATACVMVSSVLFETAEIVPGLDVVASACERRGTALLVDAYHHLNVIPFDVGAMGLPSAFVTGGGYKYCQLGEGNAFLRVPPACRLRPVLTGWFAEFSDLGDGSRGSGVTYGRGADAFAGATYDPTSHYRAAAVLRFHAEQGLSPERLHAINRRQVALLKAAIEALDLPEGLAAVVPIPDHQRGGFLALRAPQAAALSRALRSRGVLSDARGQILRLGPAPYLDDRLLRDAVAGLGVVVRGLPARGVRGG
ncbi:MAG: kynureninase [Acidobacteria bacterium]|nr:kynureninase [Acidobacteriota bacterium]